MEGLLAALFPAAAAISTTLPSADGQGLAVTPLLQPAAGCQLRYYSQQQQWYRHAEPLGQGGLCTFQLAVPPSGTVLQLIHAFVAELAGRLKLESASISAVVGLQRKVSRVRRSARVTGWGWRWGAVIAGIVVLFGRMLCVARQTTS